MCESCWVGNGDCSVPAHIAEVDTVYPGGYDYGDCGCESGCCYFCCCYYCYYSRNLESL